MKYLETIDYVRGPYMDRKTGRKGIEVFTLDGRRRYASYPKFLVEVVLGRELDRKLETVDHIDHDLHNNSWDNLRVIDLSTHSFEDHVRVRMIEVECVWCKGRTKRTLREARRGVTRRIKGPFCGKQCVSKFSAMKRNKTLSQPPQYYDQWGRYADAEPVYYTVSKGGETVADTAERLGLIPPTEEEILAALPRKKFPPRSKKKKGRARTQPATRPCLLCAEPTTNPKFCSYECHHKAQQRVKWPAEEKLRRLVWKYPTSYVAKRLGVSDVAVAKRCKKLGIEKPPRGYWMKKQAKE